MPTAKQDSAFAVELAGYTEVTLPTSALDSAIEWINDNLEPDQVFNDRKLESWAENNGYVKDES